MTRRKFACCAVMVLFTAGGCGDTSVVMHQVVKFRVRDRATLQPVSGAEGTWRVIESLPALATERANNGIAAPFLKCDEAGLSQFDAIQGQIVGVIPFPFSGLLLKRNMESKDYVSGMQCEIVVIDSNGPDVCAGTIGKNARLKGTRHYVDLTSIKRAKMRYPKDTAEN